MSDPGYPLERLRVTCLAFPEAVESGGVGDPSFKVRDKIFAMQHRMDGRPSLWVKAPDGVQEMLVRAVPDRSSGRRTSATTGGSVCGWTASSTGRSSPTSSKRATA